MGTSKTMRAEVLIQFSNTSAQNILMILSPNVQAKDNETQNV